MSGNPAQLAEYLLELVSALQELLEKMTIVVNYGIDVVDGAAVYIGLKNSAGEYPDGTWRITKDGDNCVREVKISGTWTNAGTWERPI